MLLIQENADLIQGKANKDAISVENANDAISVDSRRHSAANIAQILPLVIQGITVILVVLAILLLALVKVISAEGTLSILASVVGYVLGKVSHKKSGNDA